MNKTWKELLCMVLSAVMVLGLAACGSSKAEASAGDGDSTSGDTAADSIVLKMSTAQPDHGQKVGGSTYQRRRGGGHACSGDGPHGVYRLRPQRGGPQRQ